MAASIEGQSKSKGLGFYAAYLRDTTYETSFLLNSVKTLGKSAADAFPGIKYLFLPAAAAFAFFSFTLNALDYKRNPAERGGVKLFNLLAEGAMLLANIGGTLAFYLVSSFVGTIVFTAGLGAMALFNFGKALNALWQAYHSEGEVREKHLSAFRDSLVAGIALAAVSAGLMVAEVTGFALIANAAMAIVNGIALMYAMGVTLWRRYAKTAPEPSSPTIPTQTRVAEETPEVEHRVVKSKVTATSAPVLHAWQRNQKKNGNESAVMSLDYTPTSSGTFRP